MAARMSKVRERIFTAQIHHERSAAAMIKIDFYPVSDSEVLSTVRVNSVTKHLVQRNRQNNMSDIGCFFHSRGSANREMTATRRTAHSRLLNAGPSSKRPSRKTSTGFK